MDKNHEKSFNKCVEQLAKIFVAKSRKSKEGKQRNGKVSLVSEEIKLKWKIYDAMYNSKKLSQHRKDSYYWKLLFDNSMNVSLVLEMFRFSNQCDMDDLLQTCGLGNDDCVEKVLCFLLCLARKPSTDKHNDQLTLYNSKLNCKKINFDYSHVFFGPSKFNEEEVECGWSQLNTYRLPSLLPGSTGQQKMQVALKHTNISQQISNVDSFSFVNPKTKPYFGCSKVTDLLSDDYDGKILQDEDEGFVSGGSTPCSVKMLRNTQSRVNDSHPPYYDYRAPNYDVRDWEKCLSTKRRTYFSWDLNRGDPHTKEYYFTELGSNAYDVVWKARLRLVVDLTNFFQQQQQQNNKLILVDEAMLLSHSCLVVVGVASDTFHYNKLAQMFVVPSKVYMCGVTPTSVRNCLHQFAKCGTSYRRVMLFTSIILKSTTKINNWIQNTECILMTFCEAVQQYLHYFQENMLHYSNQCKTLQELSLALQQPSALIHYMCQLCKCGSPDIPFTQPDVDASNFPTGVSLLTYLYEEALHSTDANERFILLYLLQKCCQPYLSFVQSWVFRGLCVESSDEFMININDNNGSKRDRRRWKNYIVARNPNDIKSCVPLFLAPIAEKMFACGKSIELMQLISPQHFLCTQMFPLPRLRMSYSKIEMKKQMMEWKEYQSLLQTQEDEMILFWEEEEKSRERRRRELVNASHEVYQTQMEKLFDEKKQIILEIQQNKKMEYDRLKKQAEDDLNRRKMEKEKEASDDLHRLQMNEYRDTLHKHTDDKLFAQVKEEMEQRYAQLTRDAENREARALWKIKRHQLDNKRISFLQNQVIPELFVKSTSTSVKNIEENPSVEVDAPLVDIVENVESSVEENVDPEVDEINQHQHVESINVDVDDTTTLENKESSAEQVKKPKLKPTKEKQVHHSQSTIQNLMYYGEKEKIVSSNDIVAKRNEPCIKDTHINATSSNTDHPLPTFNVYDDHVTSIFKIFNSTNNDDKLERCRELFPAHKHSGINNSKFFTDQEDIVAADLDALPVMLLKCVLHPISVHSDLVNRCVVQHFMQNLSLMDHFEMLRHFLLLEDGEFAQTFSNNLFHIIHGNTNPADSLTPVALDSILSRSVQSSNFHDSSLIGNLFFSLTHLPAVFDPLDRDCLNCFELRYNTPWPCNIVLTESSHTKYNQVLRFLLQLKHLIWVLHDVRNQLCHIESGVTSLFRLTPSELRILHIYRHEMHNFVKIMQGYVSTQVLHVCWKEFLDSLQTNVTNLEDIYLRHSEYIHKCVLRCLLTPKAQSVFNLIRDALKCILRFHKQLSSPKSSTFRALKQTYLEFSRLSNFLYKVVLKLVEKGYQPHLENFLVRLNFNGFYKS
ncbi:gamma-tubulin complex component 6 [Ciona intestinalis]